MELDSARALRAFLVKRTRFRAPPVGVAVGRRRDPQDQRGWGWATSRSGWSPSWGILGPVDGLPPPVLLPRPLPKGGPGAERVRRGPLRAVEDNAAGEAVSRRRSSQIILPSAEKTILDEIADTDPNVFTPLNFDPVPAQTPDPAELLREKEAQEEEERRAAAELKSRKSPKSFFNFGREPTFRPGVSLFGGGRKTLSFAGSAEQEGPGGGDEDERRRGSTRQSLVGGLANRMNLVARLSNRMGTVRASLVPSAASGQQRASPRGQQSQVRLSLFGSGGGEDAEGQAGGPRASTSRRSMIGGRASMLPGVGRLSTVSRQSRGSLKQAFRSARQSAFGAAVPYTNFMVPPNDPLERALRWLLLPQGYLVVLVEACATKHPIGDFSRILRMGRPEDDEGAEEESSKYPAVCRTLGFFVLHVLSPAVVTSMLAAGGGGSDAFLANILGAPSGESPVWGRNRYWGWYQATGGVKEVESMWPSLLNGAVLARGLMGMLLGHAITMLLYLVVVVWFERMEYVSACRAAILFGLFWLSVYGVWGGIPGDFGSFVRPLPERRNMEETLLGFVLPTLLFLPVGPLLLMPCARFVCVTLFVECSLGLGWVDTLIPHFPSLFRL